MFGKKLKEARLNAGLTQKELGQLIGKDKVLICKFEGGVCLPNEKDLAIICEKLNTNPFELNFPIVATSKTRVATSNKSKSSINTYKLSVLLNKSEFSKLTKENLKSAGFNNLKEFINVAYSQLEKNLKNNMEA